jgi:hypothetical protein
MERFKPRRMLAPALYKGRSAGNWSRTELHAALSMITAYRRRDRHVGEAHGRPASRDRLCKASIASYPRAIRARTQLPRQGCPGSLAPGAAHTCLGLHPVPRRACPVPTSFSNPSPGQTTPQLGLPGPAGRARPRAAGSDDDGGVSPAGHAWPVCVAGAPPRAA